MDGASWAPRRLRRRERVVPVVPSRQRRRWSRAAQRDRAAWLHLLYLRHRDSYLPRYFAKSGTYPTPRNWLTRAWRWYASDVCVQSVRLARANGRLVREAAGVPVRRQLRELLWLSVTLPSMPEKYYTYELYRPANRARAGQYLHRHETKGALYEMLAEADNLHEVAPLNDKVAFAARARAANLAVVPTLATVKDGAVNLVAEELPAADLFVKPMAGKGGRGAQKWRYLPEPDGFRRAGQVVDVPRDRFLPTLAEQSVAQPAGPALVVQPCLVNHPELSDLALAAVVTGRVITIIDERGAPEPVIAIFRMAAVRDAVVDNMHRGGIAAPVGIGSGVLGAATGYASAGPATRYARHPVSGGVIEGRKLPLWDDVLALTVAAHERFRPRVLVGWDISIGPAGPVIVEGNEQPGVDGLQRLHDLALGSHRFGELLAFHLARRFDS